MYFSKNSLRDKIILTSQKKFIATDVTISSLIPNKMLIFVILVYKSCSYFHVKNNLM